MRGKEKQKSSRDNTLFFPIIMWLEAAPGKMGFNKNTAPAFFDGCFADIVSLNCNTVRPSNLPLPYVDAMMTGAAKHGLKVILDPQWGNNMMQLTPNEITNNWAALKAKVKEEVIDPFAGFDNLLGYAVSDEPPADKIKQWKLIVKMFNRLDPKHPDYTCFNLPSVLADVVNDEKAILENCVFDNYPHEKSVPVNTMGTHRDRGWYNKYKAFYKAMEKRLFLPQVSTVAVFKDDRTWRKPTVHEFRTTVYTSLAAGARGIMFFAYMDVMERGQMMECLVDRNWKPHALYNAVKAAAAELNYFGPVLTELQTESKTTGWNDSQRTLRGRYKNSRGGRFVITANKDPHPGHGNINAYFQLQGADYCLHETFTGQTYRANKRGIARVTLLPAQGKVLKEIMISSLPFGSIDIPKSGSKNIEGAIPVSGWALAKKGVEKLLIKRSPVNGDPPSIIGRDGLVLIGKALFVEGVRPDIEKAYPDYPDSNRAGWGYMLLTNFLPNKGNGTFVLHAVAYDIEGNCNEVGKTTITCNNAAAKKPFGAIDTPESGGTASGSRYRNYGWVLTPPPNWIPYNGKTIKVWIDGKFAGNPVYGLLREDVANAFPGYLNNSEGRGAGGYFILDTTKYENGIHTISWSAEDSAGNVEGIGSRFFKIRN